MTGFFLGMRLAVLMSSACTGALAVPTAGPAAGKPPNVLIIVTDDQRVGMLGVMPHTVRFFQNGGKTFTQGFVTTPLCCPSRSSIFTGLYAHNHGVVSNHGGHALPHDLTLQRYLHAAGYRTGIVGKFLNGWRMGRNPPYFDRWVVKGAGSGYRNPEFNVNGTVKTIRGYSTDIVSSQAVKILRGFETRDSRPWFLYVAPKAPHLPSLPEAAYARAPVPDWVKNPAVLEADKEDKPPWVQRRAVSGQWMATKRIAQFRTLMSVDDLVARVSRSLKSLGEGRRTMAFFLSDNGFMWGEHGLTRKGHPYSHSIRVPLLFRWPGHATRGSRDGRFAANIDLAPTILDAAGISPGVAMDGKSLLRVWDRKRLFTEMPARTHGGAFPSWASIRTKRKQYVEYYDDYERTHVVFREYYRLGPDPWQLTNLLRDGNPKNNPDTSRLHRLLRFYRECSGAACP
jgi:arylsulfatase A-like enzyme